VHIGTFNNGWVCLCVCARITAQRGETNSAGDACKKDNLSICSFVPDLHGLASC